MNSKQMLFWSDFVQNDVTPVNLWFLLKYIRAFISFAVRKRAVLLEWLKARSVYVASEIVTVYLWASLWELQLEFSPKGASNVWKENRDNARRVGLRARGDV